jgi:hypothetical protein
MAKEIGAANVFNNNNKKIKSVPFSSQNTSLLKQFYFSAIKLTLHVVFFVYVRHVIQLVPDSFGEYGIGR